MEDVEWGVRLVLALQVMQEGSTLLPYGAREPAVEEKKAGAMGA